MVPEPVMTYPSYRVSSGTTEVFIASPGLKPFLPKTRPDRLPSEFHSHLRER